MEQKTTCHSTRLIAFLILLLLCSCASPEKEQPLDASTEPTPSDDIISTLTMPVPEISGPKRTVAVGKFSAIGAFTDKYGNWDIGGGLGAMLTSALMESNRFIVVERANVNQILTEQEMAGSNVTSGTMGPEVGQMLGVQYMIYGAVTEFGDSDEGGGFSLGFAGGGIGNLLGGALSRQSTSGSVAMDVRLVDTTSSRVIDTIRVKEEIDSTGWDVSVGYSGIDLGTNQFKKTPLGEACRRAITMVVQDLAEKAAQAPWTGMVVGHNEGEIYINAGVNAGIEVGDRFLVEVITKKLTDPQTGEVLSVKTKQLGLIEVTEVENKISLGTFSPLGLDVPSRGDLVLQIKEKK